MIDMEDNVWFYSYSPATHIPERKLTQVLNIKAKFIASGGYHTMIIDMNDNIWACGANDNGQLGLGNNNDQNEIFEQIPDAKAKFIACGRDHTMVIGIDDTIYACGSNKYGKLGLGDYRNRNILTPLPWEKSIIKFISCGSDRTVMIDTHNNVFSCGNNNNDGLGIKNEMYEGYEKDWEEDWGNTDSIPIPIQIPDIKAKYVACGGDHTMLILTDDQPFDNVYVLPFNEMVSKLNKGDFVRFDFLPDYQIVPHRPENFIVSFYTPDNTVYLSEVKYDQTKNEINPPF
jgi:alpha-tubulin suppressor-like RCC1 family protein